MNKTFLTVFALVGIFLCGAVAGGVVAVRYVRATVQKRAADWQLNSPQSQWTRNADRLKLSADQREKINALITAYMQERQTVRKTMQAATEKLHADIVALLTPGQKAEYEKIRAKLRDTERKWQHWFQDQRAKYGDAPLATPGAQPPEKK